MNELSFISNEELIEESKEVDEVLESSLDKKEEVVEESKEVVEESKEVVEESKEAEVLESSLDKKEEVEDFLDFLEMSVEQVPVEQVPDIILEMGEEEPKEVLENTFENDSKEETKEPIIINQQNVIPIEREVLFEPFEEKTMDKVKKWWCNLFSRP
jgi:predicted nuclease with TOPRIM domain